MRTHAVSQVAPRLAFCDLIRTLGVHWGLIPLFAPPSPRFVPLEAQEECLFLNLRHEGQWDMQCRYLAAQLAAPELLTQRSRWQTEAGRLAAPVLAIGNFRAEPCAPAGLPAGSADCALITRARDLGEAFMRNMSSLTRGSAFINGCARDDSDVCKDWMGGGATVPVVTAAILQLLGNLTV